MNISVVLNYINHLIFDYRDTFNSKSETIKKRLHYRTSKINDRVTYLLSYYDQLPSETIKNELDLICDHIGPLEHYVSKLEVLDHRFTTSIIPKIKTDVVIIKILRKKEFDSESFNNFIKELATHSTNHMQLFRLRCLVARSLAQSLLLDFSNKNTSIFREITFQSEFKSAGVSILNYFAEVLEQEYPSIEAKVTIRQVARKILMIVETEHDKREYVEDILEHYGLVITGEKPASSILSNDIHIAMLENKLELALLEAKTNAKLLKMEERHSSERIESLEQQLKYMQKIFNKQHKENHVKTDIFKTLSSNQNETIINSLNQINQMVNKGISESDREAVMKEMRVLEEENSSILDKLNDYLIKGAVQGASGNILYSCINAVLRIA